MRTEMSLSRADEEAMIEVSLLLPERQMQALLLAAGCQGVTAGQMIRRLIGDFLNKSN